MRGDNDYRAYRRSAPEAPGSARERPGACSGTDPGVRLSAPGRSLPTMGSAEAHVEAGGRSVRISSPDKLLFPDAGVTKLGLATYYASVADGLDRKSVV